MNIPEAPRLASLEYAVQQTQKKDPTSTSWKVETDSRSRPLMPTHASDTCMPSTISGAHSHSFPHACEHTHKSLELPIQGLGT